jgi:hypothetical protein
MTRRATRGLLVLSVTLMSACGGGTSGPTGPSGSQSFLAGTWQGTVTIQVAPGPSGPQPATVGSTTWTFEVVPQTNLQTFKATIRSENAWLPVTTVSTAAIIPGNTPPAQLSTQGDYDSPRGCRGTFGSFGNADAARIDADFTGVDCDHVTFTGRVTLTKQ